MRGEFHKNSTKASGFLEFRKLKKNQRPFGSNRRSWERIAFVKMNRTGFDLF